MLCNCSLWKIHCLIKCWRYNADFIFNVKSWILYVGLCTTYALVISSKKGVTNARGSLPPMRGLGRANIHSITFKNLKKLISCLEPWSPMSWKSNLTIVPRSNLTTNALMMSSTTFKSSFPIWLGYLLFQSQNQGESKW